jgi:folate-binding protein YgfZ
VTGAGPIVRPAAPAAPVVALVERDVVRVAGADAVSYLQGQLSQDVAALAVGSSAPSFLLQPGGKVEAWLRVSARPDGTVLLDVEPGWAEAVVARLERFKLRVAVELSIQPGWAMLAVRQVGGAPVPPDLGPADEAFVAPVGWLGVAGYDVLGPRGALPAPGELPGAPVLVDGATYEGLRVRAGVPAMGAEATERTIPAELGQWVVDASASFTKGCYTGQELVARVDSRGGNAPRHVAGLVVAGARPPVGAQVLVDGSPVGEVTTVAPDPRGEGDVALALVGRAVQAPAPVALAWDGGAASATVVALPMADDTDVDGAGGAAPAGEPAP